MAPGLSIPLFPSMGTLSPLCLRLDPWVGSPLPKTALAAGSSTEGRGTFAQKPVKVPGRFKKQRGAQLAALPLHVGLAASGHHSHRESAAGLN